MAEPGAGDHKWEATDLWSASQFTFGAWSDCLHLKSGGPSKLRINKTAALQKV